MHGARIIIMLQAIFTIGPLLNFLKRLFFDRRKKETNRKKNVKEINEA